MKYYMPDLQSGTQTINAAAITGTTVTATTSVVTDTIAERTSAAGVTIDSVLLKDGAVNASPLKAKGPAAITTFAGTVTATASTTVTFSSAADAILAGYSATNPIFGTTLISNALTRYIMSWTNATTCVVDTAVTWAGTAITSVQLPIALFVNSAGAINGWIKADGTFTLGTPSTQNRYKIDGPLASNPGLELSSAGTTLWTWYRPSGTLDMAFEDAQVGPVFRVTGGTDNFLFGGLAAAGTSAAKVLSMGGGTMPTGALADAVQMGVAEYNGATGDQRLNIYSEETVAKKTAIGSGTVSINGAVTSGGGFTRMLAEAVSGALSGATGSIAVNVPSGARILGIQLRVDTLITSDIGTSWSAIYVNTPTTAICALQALAANTKFNAVHPAYEITTGTVTITLAPNAGTFTAGVIRAIVYYENLDNMSSL